MPSGIHQTLLLWAARRMRANGFVVAGFDDTAVQGGIWNSLPPPFLLRGHRPDAWGHRPDGKLFAFAEAKTAKDINTKHTLDQIRTFGNVRIKNSRTRCPLYIAVPRTEARRLDEVLIRAGLLDARNIIRLHVPEILLGEARRAA